MKKSLFIVAAAALMCSCANKQQFVINGDVAGLEGTVYLLEGDSLIDSAVVKEGKFQFKGIADAPGNRVLSDVAQGQPQGFIERIFIEPGVIVVTNDANDPERIQISGTPANDAASAYEDASTALGEEYNDSATTDQRRDAIREEFDAMGLTTVEANRNNYFGVLLLHNFTYKLSGQELLDQIALFSPEMQQTKALAELKTAAQQKIKTEVGQPYIDITQNDAQGQPVSLKSVIDNPANKYTLVDFWASWCGPCMGEVPVLVKTYAEFHAKGFEIYGVSFDKDKERWLGAVEENKMNWIQVSDLQLFDNQAARDYAVQGIPSNFLIDAQGVIVAKNLRGEELYEKVAELLK